MVILRVPPHGRKTKDRVSPHDSSLFCYNRPSAVPTRLGNFATNSHE